MQNIKFHPKGSFPTTTSATATTVLVTTAAATTTTTTGAAADCGKEFAIPIDSL